MAKKKKEYTQEFKGPFLLDHLSFPHPKIYAIISRLRQQGRIRYVAQGIYGLP